MALSNRIILVDMDRYLIIFRQAAGALWSYKARTLLTMLGIVIGIGTIIVMISIGQGADRSIQEQINRLGVNLLYVVSGSSSSGGARSGLGTQPTLRLTDVDTIRKTCSSVETVAYQVTGRVQAVWREKNWGTTLQGTVQEVRSVSDWSLRDGAFIDDQHQKSVANVAVLGSVVAENLFGDEVDPIGQRIRLRNVPFTVIGVLNSKGRTPDGRDNDDVIIVPYNTAIRKLLGRQLPGVVHTILVSARDKTLVPKAKWEIETALRLSHRIADGAEDDFTVGSLNEFAEAAAESTAIMRMLLIAVASVSLVVGGIGIMNIMLVTVSERTREIGVRMAIGARPGDILNQFLVEAVTISIAGGLMGSALGIVSARIVSNLAGWPTVVTVWSVLIAALFSGAIGIFFGYYPARKASQLDPIVALRYE
jgi:putative ABC transport system permease protein